MFTGTVEPGAGECPALCAGPTTPVPRLLTLKMSTLQVMPKDQMSSWKVMPKDQMLTSFGAVFSLVITHTSVV